MSNTVKRKKDIIDQVCFRHLGISWNQFLGMRNRKKVTKNNYENI